MLITILMRFSVIWLIPVFCVNEHLFDVAEFINVNLRSVNTRIASSERCCVIKTADRIIINVFMPCAGIFNRNELYNLLCDTQSWREKYSHCNCIIGGNLNGDLDSINAFLTIINSFVSNRGLSRCDLTLFTATKGMYINHDWMVRSLLTNS